MKEKEHGDTSGLWRFLAIILGIYLIYTQNPLGRIIGGTIVVIASLPPLINKMIQNSRDLKEEEDEKERKRQIKMKELEK